MKDVQYYVYNLGVNGAFYSIVANQAVSFGGEIPKELDIETYEYIKNSNYRFSIYINTSTVLTVNSDYMWLRISYNSSFANIKVEKDMKLIDAFLNGCVSINQGVTDHHVISLHNREAIPSALLKYPLTYELSDDFKTGNIYALDDADAMEMRLIL